jgi:hypothetical protein
LEELSRAAPSSKILQHLELFHAEIPVGITIDAELCGWIKFFSDIKSKIKNNDQIKAYLSVYFSKHSKIWMKYWAKKTKINLRGYEARIKCSAYKNTFPLYFTPKFLL